MKTTGYAARSAKEPLAPWSFARRATGPRDVAIDILFCGVCHSDLHTVRSEWPGTVYPCVPGHEIVGRVTEVGAEVTRFNAGGLAAVGCIVDSCRLCPNCREGLEQFCDAGFTGTYNSPDTHLGGVTYGGYSSASSSTSTSCCGCPTGWRPLGASDVVVSRNADEMARHANSFDFILDTVSARHDLEGLLALLKRDATLTLVGAPPEPPTVNPFPLVMRRRRLAGSLIGGIPETQEMLDFCAERRLGADIDVIPIQDIEKAYARMVKGDVKYRFVIDMASLPG